MVRASLFLSGSLLCTVSISYSAEEKKEVSNFFCTFHSEEREEAEKWAKNGIKIERKESWGNKEIPVGSLSACCFHKDHADKTLITPVCYPSWANWHDTSKKTKIVDRVDGRIAEFRKIAHTYKEISKAVDLNSYVLKCNYEPVRDAALIYLGEKEKQFSNQLQDGDNLQASQRKDIKLALERIGYYVTILKTSITYKHECIGLIVPKRAVMVALQWAHFADKNSEDYLCAQLNEFALGLGEDTIKKLTSSETSDSLELPENYTIAEYQLAADKKLGILYSSVF